MLNVKVCRMEGCRRSRNQLKVSIQSSQLAPSHWEFGGFIHPGTPLENSGSHRSTTPCPHNVWPSPVTALLYHNDVFVQAKVFSSLKNTEFCHLIPWTWLVMLE